MSWVASSNSHLFNILSLWKCNFLENGTECKNFKAITVLRFDVTYNYFKIKSMPITTLNVINFHRILSNYSIVAWSSVKGVYRCTRLTSRGTWRSVVQLAVTSDLYEEQGHCGEWHQGYRFHCVQNLKSHLVLKDNQWHLARLERV